MSATATPPRAKAQQPDFWKRHSPHGECPLSFAGSLLLHVLLLTGVIVVSLGLWGLGTTGENSKPPTMDVAEIEGGGGGLGGLSTGPGKLDTGEPGRHEGVESGKNIAKRVVAQAKIDPIKLPKLPNKDINLKSSPEDNPNDFKEDGVFDVLDRERIRGQAIVESQFKDPNVKPNGVAAGFAGGDKAGPQGGAGGPKGPGMGKGKGPGQGDSSAGSQLTKQRRAELRWKILASPDGEVHLKKLQALKVTLLIPLSRQPGKALRYDLSNQTVKGVIVPAKDDAGKVRWKNADPTEMRALAKVLNLPEVPMYTVIYLPSELEADMSRRELAYHGRQEWEIQMTVWDVVESDGVYNNEPTIVDQILRKNVK